MRDVIDYGDFFKSIISDNVGEVQSEMIIDREKKNAAELICTNLPHDLGVRPKQVPASLS